MVKGSTVAIAVLGLGVLGTAIGVAAALSRKSAQCPPGDVAANADGSCPAGYQSDPSWPGCCQPISPPTESLVLSANGETSALSVPSGTRIVVSVTGGVPGNPLVIAVAGSEGGPFTAAHTFCGPNGVFSSSGAYQCQPTVSCVTAPCTFYIRAIDTKTGAVSNIVALTGT